MRNGRRRLRHASVRRQVWWRILAALASALVCPTLYAESPAQKITLSVVPQFTVVDINANWVPFLARLESLTGFAYELRHYGSIRQFEEGFLRGEPDVAYMNPYHAVMAKRAQGYLPLLHDIVPMTGILVVRADSKLESVKQLNGSRVAFPSPNAFGAALWMRALLEKDGITFMPHYVQTHQNVFRSVLLGVVPAGGAIRSTLAREPDDVRSKLRILYETPPVAAHPLAVHPRVPQAARDRILAAILALEAGNEKDRRLLAAIAIEHPVPADYGRDYAPLESYNLDRLVMQK